jgi:quercetin dioxygenase-like cupin family protein
MYVEGKVWGTTQPLIVTPLVEVHKVRAKAGGFCSKHSHTRKWNAFLVIEGRLKIKVWKQDYDLVDETTLLPGDITTVRPGEVHQFVVPEDHDCVFLEIYYLEGLGPDITRTTCGGASPS